MLVAALRRARLLFSSVSVVFSLVVATPVIAADNDVIQIEEHWELQVGGPDTARSAPQVTMIMSPRYNLTGEFFAFTLNHCTYPDFAAGGYQIQLWQGEDCVSAVYGAATSPLDSDGEVITWVQRLTLSDGVLKFQVLNGQSGSWGNFGGESFAISLSTQLTRLNGYRPSISTGQSGIGYAGNRVSSLILQRIRWITADGEEHEMVAPIDIALNLDP